MVKMINTGRRKKYLDKLSFIVTAQPELIYSLLIIMCDELSINDLDRVYRQVKIVSVDPPVTKQELAKRN